VQKTAPVDRDRLNELLNKLWVVNEGGRNKLIARKTAKPTIKIKEKKEGNQQKRD
jgi:hypothetical protein